MKFQLVGQKEKICGIKIFSQNLIIGDMNNNLFINQNLIAVDVDTQSASLIIFNNLLFFNIEDKKFCYDFFQSKLSELGNIHPYFNSISISTKEVLGTHNSRIENGKFVWDTILYDLDKNIILKTLPKLANVSIAEIFNNNNIVTYKGASGFANFSLLTGNYEWETDLSHYRFRMSGQKYEASIQQVIGVWEGQLLVWMQGNMFLSLSVETGEVLWEIRKWEYTEGKGHGYHFSQGVHLDEAAGKCYLFECTCYLEIDLATQKTTILWQEDGISYGMRFARPSFTKDYIYFLGGGFSSNSVGVFNRKTLQIDWLHQFEFDQSGVEYIQLNQPPQVADDKLYVLDTGGTLHIFEREERT